MTKEELLDRETFKSENYETERRVWETVGTDSPRHVVKLLGLLIDHLEQKGLISDSELDDLLLRTVRN